MRVLLIEDHPATARSLELMLRPAGFASSSTDLGEDGVELAKLYPFDLIVLDLHLPDMSGHEVLRQLRRAQVITPVLILTGDDRIDSKITGFERGADDYLTKPFERQELLARVHALIRRSQGHAEPILRIGPVELNFQERTLSVAGDPVSLSGKEYAVLEVLALRKGGTVPKNLILDHLYGGVDEPEIKIIDVFVCKLRRKFAQAGVTWPLIETVWGQGYRLKEPPALAVPQAEVVAA